MDFDLLFFTKTIQDGKLEQAITELLALTHQHQSRLRNEVVLHSASLQQVLLDERKGIVDSDTIRREKKRITNSILELLDELKIEFPKLIKNLSETNGASQVGTSTNNSQPFRSILWERLIGLFSHEELKNICFELHCDYERFNLSTKDSMVRDLIIHCERTDRLNILVAICKRERPNIDWVSQDSI